MEQEQAVTEMQIENEYDSLLTMTDEQDNDKFEEEMLIELLNEKTQEPVEKEQLTVATELPTVDMVSSEISYEEEMMEIDEQKNESIMTHKDEETVELTSEDETGTSPVASTVTNTKGSFQCSRLYRCIQAAVARLFSSEKSTEWGSRRITILLNLIPQRPIFPLVSVWLHPPLSDDSYFYATLVRHILFVLKEREEILDEDSGWVLNEAMSKRKLQSGGTFRNVLSRKLDEVIIPIFAEVLVSIDRYSNLDLVRKGSPPHIRQLWLSAFPILCKFSYADITTQGGDQLAGMGQRRSTSSEFQCQFPFFWLVKETVDSHWDNAISVTG